MAELTFKSFFTYYLYHPESPLLPKDDQILAKRYSQMFKWGTLFIGKPVCKCFFYKERSFSIIKQNNMEKVNKVISKHLLKGEGAQPKSPSNFPLTEKIEELSSRKEHDIHENLGQVYVVTNESSLEESRTKLTETPPKDNSCHIGCAGWHNFDIMCQRQSKCGVLFDYDPQTTLFIKATIQILVNSGDRNEFVDTVIKFIESGEMKFDTTVERIRNELTREGSWLSSDKNFNYIKELALGGKIATFTEDITNTQTFSNLKGLIKENGYTVDSVYLSNIRVFLKSENRKEFFKNSLNAITDSDTLVINCPEFSRTDSTETRANRQEEWNELNLRQLVLTGASLHQNPEQYFSAQMDRKF